MRVIEKPVHIVLIFHQYVGSTILISCLKKYSKLNSHEINERYASTERILELRRQVRRAIRDKKIFTIERGYNSVRTALRERGWLEKYWDDQGIPNGMTIDQLLVTLAKGASSEDSIRQCENNIISKLIGRAEPNFCWAVQGIENRALCNFKKSTIINGFARSQFTSKAGLCDTIYEMYWYYKKDVAYTRFPRCYNTIYPEHLAAFIKDFKITACISLLKKFISQLESLTPNCKHSSEKSLPYDVVQFAVDRCLEFVAFRNHDDIDREDTYIPPLTWTWFMEHHHKFVHGLQLFVDHLDPDINIWVAIIQSTLRQIKPFWPQFDLDGIRNLWILKPSYLSRGRGIIIVNRYEQILDLINKFNKRYVVQKYLESPLLIHGVKFDIRQWFLITSIDPLVVWIYKASYLRFCSKDYDIKNYHESVHLTNHSIQYKYQNSPRHTQLPRENMWPFHVFKSYLLWTGNGDKWDTVIYPGMKQSLAAVMLASQERMVHRDKCFQLYGADFILDEQFNPWLLEINSTPDMGASTSVTQVLCPQCLKDTIKVVIDCEGYPLGDSGLFELVIRQEKFIPKEDIGELIVYGKNIKIIKEVEETYSLGDVYIEKSKEIIDLNIIPKKVDKVKSEVKIYEAEMEKNIIRRKISDNIIKKQNNSILNVPLQLQEDCTPTIKLPHNQILINNVSKKINLIRRYIQRYLKSKSKIQAKVENRMPRAKVSTKEIKNNWPPKRNSCLPLTALTRLLHSTKKASWNIATRKSHTEMWVQNYAKYIRVMNFSRNVSRMSEKMKILGELSHILKRKTEKMLGIEKAISNSQCLKQFKQTKPVDQKLNTNIVTQLTILHDNIHKYIKTDELLKTQSVTRTVQPQSVKSKNNVKQVMIPAKVEDKCGTFRIENIVGQVYSRVKRNRKLELEPFNLEITEPIRPKVKIIPKVSIPLLFTIKSNRKLVRKPAFSDSQIVSAHKPRPVDIQTGSKWKSRIVESKKCTWTFRLHNDNLLWISLGCEWDAFIQPVLKKSLLRAMISAQDKFHIYGKDIILDFSPLLLYVNNKGYPERLSYATTFVCSSCMNNLMKVVLGRRFSIATDYGVFSRRRKESFIFQKLSACNLANLHFILNSARKSTEQLPLWFELCKISTRNLSENVAISDTKVKSSISEQKTKGRIIIKRKLPSHCVDVEFQPNRKKRKIVPKMLTTIVRNIQILRVSISKYLDRKKQKQQRIMFEESVSKFKMLEEVHAKSMEILTKYQSDEFIENEKVINIIEPTQTVSSQSMDNGKEIKEKRTRIILTTLPRFSSESDSIISTPSSNSIIVKPLQQQLMVKNNPNCINSRFISKSENDVAWATHSKSSGNESIDSSKRMFSEVKISSQKTRRRLRTATTRKSPAYNNQQEMLRTKKIVSEKYLRNPNPSARSELVSTEMEWLQLATLKNQQYLEKRARERSARPGSVTYFRHPNDKIYTSTTNSKKAASELNVLSKETNRQRVVRKQKSKSACKKKSTPLKNEKAIIMDRKCAHIIHEMKHSIRPGHEFFRSARRQFTAELNDVCCYPCLLEYRKPSSPNVNQHVSRESRIIKISKSKEVFSHDDVFNVQASKRQKPLKSILKRSSNRSPTKLSTKTARCQATKLGSSPKPSVSFQKTKMYNNSMVKSTRKPKIMTYLNMTSTNIYSPFNELLKQIKASRELETICEIDETDLSENEVKKIQHTVTSNRDLNSLNKKGIILETSFNGINIPITTNAPPINATATRSRSFNPASKWSSNSILNAHLSTFENICPEIVDRINERFNTNKYVSTLNSESNCTKDSKPKYGDENIPNKFDYQMNEENANAESGDSLDDECENISSEKDNQVVKKRQRKIFTYINKNLGKNMNTFKSEKTVHQRETEIPKKDSDSSISSFDKDSNKPKNTVKEKFRTAQNSFCRLRNIKYKNGSNEPNLYPNSGISKEILNSIKCDATVKRSQHSSRSEHRTSFDGRKNGSKLQETREEHLNEVFKETEKQKVIKYENKSIKCAHSHPSSFDSIKQLKNKKPRIKNRRSSLGTIFDGPRKRNNRRESVKTISDEMKSIVTNKYNDNVPLKPVVSHLLGSLRASLDGLCHVQLSSVPHKSSSYSFCEIMSNY